MMVSDFGAYGPKIIDQLDHVVSALVNDPDSRQAGLTIWRENPPKTKDVPCTVAIFASIKNGELNLSVYMRSSDVWLGLPYDVFTFSMLAHLICCRINSRLPRLFPKIYVGHLYLTAANQHVYESDFDNLYKVLDTYPGKPAFDQPVPNELCESEELLFTTLKALRDSKPGDAVRWWENQQFDIVSEYVKVGTNYQDVQNFHKKFGVPTATEPSFLGTELYGFREKFMQEELDEFRVACRAKDMEGAADALVDLVSVTLGTADMMGLPWQELWDKVHRANMSKVRAECAEQSKRGTAFDVIKPAGWTAPDHCDALIKASSSSSSSKTEENGVWPMFTGYKP
jgi:predicted HAD superfamily Cof-like phosphohydrolase